LVVVIERPLTDHGINGARCIVAWNGLGEHVAGLSTERGLGNNGAEEDLASNNTIRSSARLGAYTNLLAIGSRIAGNNGNLRVAVKGSPVAQNAVSGAWAWVAVDDLGQSWTCLATKLDIGNHEAIGSLLSVTASGRAGAAVAGLGDEIRVCTEDGRVVSV